MFYFIIVYFGNFRGSKNRGSMDPVHISVDPVHGPGPRRGSMDQYSIHIHCPWTGSMDQYSIHIHSYSCSVLIRYGKKD